MGKKKRYAVYVTLENGAIMKEMVPLTFTDKNIEMYLNSKYGTQKWLQTEIKKRKNG